MQPVLIPDMPHRSPRRSDWAALAKRPTAFLPVLMSLAALTLVLVHIAWFGTQRQADEGTPAHLFQLLMAAQLPIIATFAAKSLPQAPRRALGVLAIQLIAAIAAFAPVFYFNL
jgi:hypothetical protein